MRLFYLNITLGLEKYQVSVFHQEVIVLTAYLWIQAVEGNFSSSLEVLVCLADLRLKGLRSVTWVRSFHRPQCIVSCNSKSDIFQTQCNFQIEQTHYSSLQFCGKNRRVVYSFNIAILGYLSLCNARCICRGNPSIFEG